MKLDEAIRKANSLQNYVGVVVKEGKSVVQYVVIASTDEKTHHEFIAKAVHGNIDYASLAMTLGATDFDVVFIFDDGLHTSRLSYGWADRYIE